MFGLKEVGVLGASVALAGGVAYLIWNYASSSGERKPETRPGEGGESGREEGEGKEEKRREERREEAEQTVVVAAAKPQKASEVKGSFTGHTCMLECSIMYFKYIFIFTLMFSQGKM